MLWIIFDVCRLSTTFFTGDIISVLMSGSPPFYKLFSLLVIPVTLCALAEIQSTSERVVFRFNWRFSCGGGRSNTARMRAAFVN